MLPLVTLFACTGTRVISIGSGGEPDDTGAIVVDTGDEVLPGDTDTADEDDPPDVP
jgi:hypothetical protein